MARHHTYLLDQLFNALPADAWRIRVISRWIDEQTDKRGRTTHSVNRSRCHFDETVSPHDLLRKMIANAHPQGKRAERSLLSTITEQSRYGREVLMQPIGAMTHVLLDLDDTPLDEALNLLALDRVRPAVIHETSPNRHHLVFTLPGRNHAPEVHKAASRWLVGRVCGDIGSAHVGASLHMPATTCSKPWRHPSPSPLVIQRRAKFTTSRALLEYASRSVGDSNVLTTAQPKLLKSENEITVDQVPSAVRMLHAELMHKHADDRSVADFAFCCTLLRALEERAVVETWLVALSDKAPRRPGYVVATVDAAHRAIGQKEPSP